MLKGIIMIFKFLKTTVICTTLILSSVAQAGLIRTTMDLTITGVTGSYSNVAVADVFKFSVEYNDEGTYMRWSETSWFCLSTHVPVPGVTCDESYDANRYKFFSDAVSNYTEMFDFTAMQTAGISTDLLYSRFMRARVFGWGDLQTWEMLRVGNGHALALSYERDGEMRIGYIDGNEIAKQSVVSFLTSNITRSKVEVPEPSTLAIFALGMIGLASRRFKKQS